MYPLTHFDESQNHTLDIILRIKFLLLVRLTQDLTHAGFYAHFTFSLNNRNNIKECKLPRGIV